MINPMHQTAIWFIQISLITENDSAGKREPIIITSKVINIFFILKYFIKSGKMDPACWISSL